MLLIEDMWVTRGADYRIELPHLGLERGQVRALVGASGCGKSTLLEMIGLILRPHGLGRFGLGESRAVSDGGDAAGRALADYQTAENAADTIDVAALITAGAQRALAAIRARHLGFVLQTGGLLPFLSVRQNIALPRRLLGLPVEDVLISDALGRLELAPLLDRLPGQLSIGERQRAAFVRAIAHRPQVLLADEPTAALDPPQAKRLFALMLEIAQRLNIAVLVVSHDWALVEACSISALHGKPQRGRAGTVFADA